MATSDANPAIATNKDIVLAAVRQNGRALAWASLELRADKEVVLAAVAEDGRALEWAGPTLRADPDIVLVARTQQGQVLQDASPALQADRDAGVQAAVNSTASGAVDWHRRLRTRSDPGTRGCAGVKGPAVIRNHDDDPDL